MLAIALWPSNRLLRPRWRRPLSCSAAHSRRSVAQGAVHAAALPRLGRKSNCSILNGGVPVGVRVEPFCYVERSMWSEARRYCTMDGVTSANGQHSSEGRSETGCLSAFSGHVISREPGLDRTSLVPSDAKLRGIILQDAVCASQPSLGAEGAVGVLRRSVR